jgi:hypothetical protein
MATRTPFTACKLTPAECALLDVLSERMNLSYAAETLGISVKATATRAQIIREKFCVDTTAQAVAVWKERKAA